MHMSKQFYIPPGGVKRSLAPRYFVVRSITQGMSHAARSLRRQNLRNARQQPFPEPHVTPRTCPRVPKAQPRKPLTDLVSHQHVYSFTFHILSRISLARFSISLSQIRSSPAGSTLYTQPSTLSCRRLRPPPRPSRPPSHPHQWYPHPRPPPLSLPPRPPASIPAPFREATPPAPPPPPPPSPRSRPYPCLSPPPCPDPDRDRDVTAADELEVNHEKACTNCSRQKRLGYVPRNGRVNRECNVLRNHSHGSAS